MENIQGGKFGGRRTYGAQLGFLGSVGTIAPQLDFSLFFLDFRWNFTEFFCRTD
jgi:hypothetical protein